MEECEEGGAETGSGAWRRGLGPNTQGMLTPDPPTQTPTFSLVWAAGGLGPWKEVEMKTVSVI